MKKQFLILTSLVFLASISALGQALPGSAPRGVNCTDDALHPIAGKPYPYQAVATPSGGNFTFWATKDANFITTVGATTTTNISTMLQSPTTTPAGTDLIATSANYGTPATTDNVNITWSDAILNGTTAASPTFVAAHYAAPVAGCSDNFRVWSITPIFAFTVDVKNVENVSNNTMNYDAQDDQCMDQVRGAQYVAGAMQYDFGTQYLYYEIVAANFSNYWVPTLSLTGLAPTASPVQTATIEYTFDIPSSWGAGTVWNPYIAGTTQFATNEANTYTGVSVYIRVTIHNNNYEGLNATPITLTVDGQNSLAQWDIENNTLTDPGPLCNPTIGPDQMDVAVQNLLPRPTLAPVTPTPFVPGNEQN